MTRRPSRDGLHLAGSTATTGPIAQPQATRIVHLGIGAFSRAHPILFTELAAERADDATWGVLGVTGRRPAVATALAAQEHLYGVLFRAEQQASVRWVGSLTGVAAAQERARVVGAVAAASTDIVTLTVTEKAYTPDSAPIRLLVDGLRRRHAHGGAPLTVLSCDNLRGNGHLISGVVQNALIGAPSGLLRWLDRDVAFPDSMVDRITPETTDEDRAVAARLSGFEDAALVVAEPFGQWVIEDRFAAARPPWESAGAQLVADVTAFEAVKLRLLNGAHTLIACAGAAIGIATIAEAMTDPVLRGWCERWQLDAARGLETPGGSPLIEYAATVRSRFANTGLRHTTRQIARDTSQKIWMRVLLSASEDLSAGRSAEGAAYVLGAWTAFVAGETRRGVELEDPQADVLARAVGAAHGRAESMVMGLLDVVPEAPPAQAWDRSFVAQAAKHADAILAARRR